MGTIILPDYLMYYLKSYRIGKQVNVFHCLDFKPILKVNIDNLRQAIFSKKQIQAIKNLQYESI